MVARTSDEVRSEPRLSNREARGQLILRSALEELARVGYNALRIEDVATRAGVNKTTVYRRFPAKSDLVRSAFSVFIAEKAAEPDTGSLRGDLREIGRSFFAISSSIEGQCLMRVMMLERVNTELADLAKGMEAESLRHFELVFRRAKERGELRPDADPRLLILMFIGALHFKMFMHNEPVDELLIDRVVETLLYGVLASEVRPPSRRTRST